MDDPVFRMIEIIESNFPNQPKNVVFPVTVPQTRERGYTVAFTAGKFWIYLSVVIGPRGGIQEQLVAYDPTEKVVIDKLFLCTRINTLAFMDCGLLDLRELRSSLAYLGPQEQEKIITETLLVEARQAETAPAHFEEKVLAIQRSLAASSSRKPIMWYKSSLIFVCSVK